MKWLRKIRKFWVVAVLIIIINPAQLNCANKWNPIREPSSVAKSIAKVGETEILTSSSVIMLSLGQTSKVEVFTILGRIVCEETLHPGVYELTMDTHGVYIIKIGDVTCKVAI